MPFHLALPQTNELKEKVKKLTELTPEEYVKEYLEQYKEAIKESRQMVIDNEREGYQMMKALTKITKRSGLVREIYNEDGEKLNDVAEVGRVIARNLPFRTER